MEQLSTQSLTTKALFAQENVKKKFEEILGKKAPAFITSVLQIVASNRMTQPVVKIIWPNIFKL